MSRAIWTLSDRCDPVARVIADRHYNRQSVGAPNFVDVGRTRGGLVALGLPVDALPRAEAPVGAQGSLWAGAA